MYRSLAARHVLRGVEAAPDILHADSVLLLQYRLQEETLNIARHFSFPITVRVTIYYIPPPAPSRVPPLGHIGWLYNKKTMAQSHAPTED